MSLINYFVNLTDDKPFRRVGLMFDSQDFPGSPVVKNLPSNAEDVGSIPGQGTKIPPAIAATKTFALHHMPQLLSLYTATKTQHSQINKNFKMFISLPFVVSVME